MRQQTSSPERALASVSRKTTVKTCRRDDVVGNGKRVGDCLNLGDGKVLIKMPGNRLKVASSSHQGKEQDDCENKVSEVSEDCVKDENELLEEGQKRPLPDGVNLLQWGQKKRLRFSRIEAKAVVEETSGLKKAVKRPDRRVVRAEKVSAVQSKGLSAAPCSPSTQRLANGDSRRDGEGTSATPSARNINHCQENNGLGSEANTARNTDVNTQELEVNPDKVTVSPANTTGGLATVSARTEENAYQERAALLEKVDLELFQWPKFLISLSRKEKEDDFFVIKGAKLPQRPKKRLKHVEKALHYISPGTWLCELTRERYEVREKKATKKKPRGLKAMGSADSDTD